MTYRYITYQRMICDQCGGNDSRNGLGGYAHLHSKRHIEALRKSENIHAQVMADKLERENEQRRGKR